ncbi:MAG: tetratricopeptide repeat protein [Roseibacillus sp.]
MKVAHSFFRVLFLSLLTIFTAVAQEETDPSKLDPSDIYFQGWMALRDADEYHKEEDFQKAFEAATRCKRLIDTVTLYHPQWKPHLIERKQKEALSKLETLASLLPDLNNSGLRLYQGNAAAPTPTVSPGLTPAEVMQATQIQRELAEIRTKLSKADDLRNAEAARYQRRIRELTAERDKLAESTLQMEVKELKNRIDLVEEEKRILARQLSDTRGELDQALTKVADLDKKEKESRKVANQLNEMLKKERNVAGDVIDGLRGQQQKLTKELKETKQLLAVERQQSQRLERLLTDARGEVESLTTERNHLLKERDHLSELLQLNQGDRIQRLIEQNMTLARNLREAEEAMQNLVNNADANAEDLLNAKRDLAMAKSQIIDSRQESDAELERNQSLELKLKDAYAELKARENLADIDSDLLEENRVLRDVADRLIRTQKRRREEANLLLQTAKEDKEDETLMAAVQQLVGEEINLTPDEKLMFNRAGADGQFKLNMGRNNPEDVELSNAQLRRYISALGTAIEKAYSRGKTEVALDLCEQLLDEHPGHVPTMVNQGVIRLKMGFPDMAIESFNNAATMQIAPLPYAHYMKGVAYHSLKKFENAQKEYELAIKLDSTNADAHSRLGGIYVQQGRTGEARELFEKAYRIDNNKPGPLFNLALLHSRLNEEKAALNYYRQFRKAGGQPNPDFERMLSKAKPEATEEPIPSTATPVISAP